MWVTAAFFCRKEIMFFSHCIGLTKIFFSSFAIYFLSIRRRSFCAAYRPTYSASCERAARWTFARAAGSEAARSTFEIPVMAVLIR